MTKEIKLECGKVIIKDYGSNLEVFFDGRWFSYSFDDAIEYSFDENFNSFIEDRFEYEFNVKLSNADKEELKDCLEVPFYMHSKEAYGN